MLSYGAVLRSAKSSRHCSEGVMKASQPYGFHHNVVFLDISRGVQLPKGNAGAPVGPDSLGSATPIPPTPPPLLCPTNRGGTLCHDGQRESTECGTHLTTCRCASTAARRTTFIGTPRTASWNCVGCHHPHTTPEERAIPRDRRPRPPPAHHAAVFFS